MTARPQRPTALIVFPENLPASLTTLDRWVTWRYRRDGPRWRKVPKDCKTGRTARVNDPICWSAFDAVCATLQRRKRDRPDGLGFVLAAGDGLAGVDLDNCRDPATGQVESWAMTIIRQLDTYTEVSPSGTGVKLLLRGQLPPSGRRAGRVEMYDDRRFFALTGHRLAGSPAEVMDRGEALLDLHGRVFPPADHRTPEEAFRGRTFPGGALTDDEVIAHLQNGPEGEKFARLLAGEWGSYQSQSEADLALCGILARMVGADEERIERLFGRSKLATRDKWTAADGYRGRTVYRAVYGLLQYSGMKSGATTTLTMTTQDLSDPSELTQHGDGKSRHHSPAQKLEEAITAAIELACEQESQGDDFEHSFALARRLLNFSTKPEPLMPAVQAYCAETGRVFEEFWLRVLECWPRVKRAEGDGDWAWAQRMAVEQPVDFLPGMGPEVNRVASLAYYLSTRRKPFPFPVEKVGEAIGMSTQMGSVTRKLLQQEKVIALVRKYDRHLGLADEFDFLKEFPPRTGDEAGP